MADQSPPAPPLKAHLSQIESIDKHVDRANRVALVNEIISGHLPSGRHVSIVPKTDLAGMAGSGAKRLSLAGFFKRLSFRVFQPNLPFPEVIGRRWHVRLAAACVRGKHQLALARHR